MQFKLVKCERAVQFSPSPVGSSSDFSLTRERRSAGDVNASLFGTNIGFHDNDLVVDDTTTGYGLDLCTVKYLPGISLYHISTSLHAWLHC